jgi:methylmalonyl-CoA mutase N-terminal domain/subunit
MDPEGYNRQINRLKTLREERDNDRVEQTLNAVRRACVDGENTMPYLIDAAKAYATLGEIVDVMREEFGVYQEPVQI